MRLVDIDKCDRKLFYKQFGGKDSFITLEGAFDMMMALPVVTESEIYNKALEDFSQGLKDYVYTERIKGNEPYWAVAIDYIRNELILGR